MEEFLYRAVKRRWHEMAGSQRPEGEAVKDSEQVGCHLGARCQSVPGCRAMAQVSAGTVQGQEGRGSGMKGHGEWQGHPRRAVGRTAMRVLPSVVM